MTSSERRNVERYLRSRKGSRCRRRIEGEKVECEKCGSSRELEWHHKRYWSEGGEDSDENLQVLCKSCHCSIHQEKNDFRIAGRWGGLVSAYVREERLGKERFCRAMRELAMRRTA